MFGNFKNKSKYSRNYTLRELRELEEQEKALSKWMKEEANRKHRKWRWGTKRA